MFVNEEEYKKIKNFNHLFSAMKSAAILKGREKYDILDRQEKITLLIYENNLILEEELKLLKNELEGNKGKIKDMEKANQITQGD